MDDFLDEMDDFEHMQHYMYEDPGYADYHSPEPRPAPTTRTIFNRQTKQTATHPAMCQKQILSFIKLGTVAWLVYWVFGKRFST